jgi:ribose 5-phosphate isomerase B
MTSLFQNHFIACDHGGLELKNSILEKFPHLNWKDFGTNDAASVDYPDFAAQVTAAVRKPGDVGILICGSGQGMAMRANREKHIRAALCWTPEVARLARSHNDANVLCLGGRLLAHDLALEIVDVFLTTAFEGGRHANRVNKLSC